MALRKSIKNHAAVRKKKNECEQWGASLMFSSFDWNKRMRYSKHIKYQ